MIKDQVAHYQIPDALLQDEHSSHRPPYLMDNIILTRKTALESLSIQMIMDSNQEGTKAYSRID